MQTTTDHTNMRLYCIEVMVPDRIYIPYEIHKHIYVQLTVEDTTTKIMCCTKNSLQSILNLGLKSKFSIW